MDKIDRKKESALERATRRYQHNSLSLLNRLAEQQRKKREESGRYE